jgi:hypothetical protein
MPAPPPWWITGWVDRFLRLFLLVALTSNEDKGKNLKLHNIYDTSIAVRTGVVYRESERCRPLHGCPISTTGLARSRIFRAASPFCNRSGSHALCSVLDPFLRLCS